MPASGETAERPERHTRSSSQMSAGRLVAMMILESAHMQPVIPRLGSGVSAADQAVRYGRYP